MLCNVLLLLHTSHFKTWNKVRSLFKTQEKYFQWFRYHWKTFTNNFLAFMFHKLSQKFCLHFIFSRFIILVPINNYVIQLQYEKWNPQRGCFVIQICTDYFSYSQPQFSIFIGGCVGVPGRINRGPYGSRLDVAWQKLFFDRRRFFNSIFSYLEQHTQTNIRQGLTLIKMLRLDSYRETDCCSLWFPISSIQLLSS